MRKETLLKIADLMRNNLDSGLTILEVSKKLKIGYRPAYNHLIAMGEEGMVKIEVIGNAKRCSLNLRSPKCRHLLEELDSVKKEAIYRQCPKIKSVIGTLESMLTGAHISDIHSIVLFGSHAKGTATKASDVDLLFIVADMKKAGLRESIERESASYQHSHNVKVSPIVTDIAEFRKMLEADGLNVGKEAREHGISLYGSEMFWRLLS